MHPFSAQVSSSISEAAYDGDRLTYRRALLLSPLDYISKGSVALFPDSAQGSSTLFLLLHPLPPGRQMSSSRFLHRGPTPDDYASSDEGEDLPSAFAGLELDRQGNLLLSETLASIAQRYGQADLPVPTLRPHPAAIRSSPATRGPPGDGERDLSKPLELLVLGSGGSAAVPDIACVTDPDGRGCEGCRKAVGGGKEGRANTRGNTGVAIRVPWSDGDEKTILIDCGKTFREQAIKLFAKNGLRQIDALLLTHHHADAVDGLDDLRAWTWKSAIETTIPIYCSKPTYDYVAIGFPYLISKKAASGGGALPSFDWRVIEQDKPFELFGVQIQPLPAHHGVYFKGVQKPLICLGYLIDRSLLYMSDVSFIPPKTHKIIKRCLTLPTASGEFLSQPSSLRPRLQCLIIDCDGLIGSTSHYGVGQAIALAHKLGAVRTYFTDFPHKTSHECWEYACRQFSKGRTARRGIPHEASDFARLYAFPYEHAEGDRQPLYKDAYEGFDPKEEDFELFTERMLESIEAWMGGVLPQRWVRPLRDGMTISWTKTDVHDDGTV